MIKQFLSGTGVVFLTLLLLSNTGLAQDAEIVANLERVKGNVTVTEGQSQQDVKGRNGLLLRVGDLVMTDFDARATIKFRDGSEIRLFSNTQFLIEKVSETADEERGFKFDLFTKIGSFWANFVRQRQTASLRTPTATIGIKGTTLRVVERDGHARVALTEGLIDVSNDRTTIELKPGFRLTDFTKRDDLAQKIEPIPFKVDVKSETRELVFEQNRPSEIFITLQLIDIKSGANVARSGPIYLRSNYDNITYPQAPALDQRGFTRVPLIFGVPNASHAELDGSIYVWALIDNEEADDTAEGRILFRFQAPSVEDRIRIESETGEGRRSR